jgi:hypothetical protein
MLTSSITWIDLVSLVVLPILLPLAVGLVSTAAWPTFWKRLTLFLLAFATTALTELLDHIAAGNPYDIGMAFLRAVATYLAAEGTYLKFYKAPLNNVITIPSTVVKTEIVGPDYQSMTVTELRNLLGLAAPKGALKADLIKILESMPTASVEVSESPAPKTIASIVQSHGVG